LSTLIGADLNRLPAVGLLIGLGVGFIDMAIAHAITGKW
jgi:hypothetical protein